MSANRLKLIKGASASFDVDLVDQFGEPIATERLDGAIATFTIRTTPAGSDVVQYITPDAHLTIDVNASDVTITFSVGDTTALALGAYFYELKLQLTDGEVVLPIEWAPLDVGLGGAADETQPTFDNVIKLNHDFPLPGDMTYMTPGGSPIVDAQIRVYLKADYDAGLVESPIGRTSTNAYGKWAHTILVVPGYSYVVTFFKPNEFGPDVMPVVGV